MEKCRRTKRPQFRSKNWEYSWQWKSSKMRQQLYRSESFSMNTETLTSGSTGKNHISPKTIFGYKCNTENFVPILVRGLSSSSSSCSHPSTSMTPSRQERNHPTSSSSSSTSPTTTVSSDSETRAREDLSGIDSQRVSGSSEHDERKEWWAPFTKPTKIPEPIKKRRPRERTGRPVLFRNPGMAARIQTKTRGWQSSWTQRLTRQFFSWTVFRAYAYDKCGFWLNTVVILTSLKTEIARSARGPT